MTVTYYQNAGELLDDIAAIVFDNVIDEANRQLRNIGPELDDDEQAALAVLVDEHVEHRFEASILDLSGRADAASLADRYAPEPYEIIDMIEAARRIAINRMVERAYREDYSTK
jgi:hypothetical protein